MKVTKQLTTLPKQVYQNLPMAQIPIPLNDLKSHTFYILFKIVLVHFPGNEVPYLGLTKIPPSE